MGASGYRACSASVEPPPLLHAGLHSSHPSTGPDGHPTPGLTLRDGRKVKLIATVVMKL